MSKFRVVNADCLVALKKLADASIDAVVTDPPYELGFMSKKWDASGIAYSVELWREVLRVLKPGGHLLAFGGTRTYHRMTCAIEDAGFEIRDCIQWIYGTGFPKSLNIGGGRGTALKPANEPIVLARKPLVGTVAETVQAHGTGALNIDECRIEAGAEYTESKGNSTPSRMAVNSFAAAEQGALKATRAEPSAIGRWPANVIFDEDAAAVLDEQSGVLKSGALKPYKENHVNAPSFKLATREKTYTSAANEGGASRFFYVAKPSRKERDLGCGKNNHPTVKPIQLMRYLCRLITPPRGVILDPFTGSGTTGMAAVLEGFDFLGFEREEEYVKLAEARIKAVGNKEQDRE